MAYPGVERLELPVLQELAATGGAEDVRFLYDRLVGYFPQLEESDVQLTNGHRRSWRRLVQTAGRALDDKRQIERRRGFWTITQQGRRRVADEELQFSLSDSHQQDATPATAELSHADVQQMLCEIGRTLGHHAEREFDYYDVVWRAGEDSPRLSHVFEVQRKGNVDAALAKLKRAYDAQRSKPFLIVASERDSRRAEMQTSLSRTGAFHEIGRVTTILSFEQLRRLHRALHSVEDVLGHFFER
ncbi:MAG TPA: hypothetical protein VER08_11250 [Pyrinomonadaceae bacterium]|nr:hypothetical protein [Pyrinomonadaceae bacterium]